MCREEAIKVLGEVHEGVSEILPVPIHDAYLYGSYARGDYTKESDIDILLTVDLDWPEISAYRSAVSRLVSDLCLKYDVTVSVTFAPVKLFVQFAEDLPFYRNVMTEGLRYVA